MTVYILYRTPYRRHGALEYAWLRRQLRTWAFLLVAAGSSFDLYRIRPGNSVRATVSRPLESVYYAFQFTQWLPIS
jgi:hypothetical protein